MNSKIFKLLFLSIFFFTYLSTISAQNYKHLACISYVSKSEQKWEWIINTFQKKETNIKLKQKTDLIGYYYGYISLLLNEKKFDKAKIYVQKGEILLDNYLKNHPKNSALNSFKGAFIGFHIGLSKFSAIYLASSSNKYVDKALSINPYNCQALIDKGNILLHTPTIFGGNKNKAIIFYTKAFKLYEKRKETKDNWMYINALDNLIKAYNRTEQTQKEKIILKKRNSFVQNIEK